MKLITAALLLGAVSAVSGKTSNLRSSRQLQDEVVYGTYLEADIQYADHSDGHLDAIALPDGTILDIEDDDDADDDVKTRGPGWFRKNGYESGDTEIALTGRVEGSKFKLTKLPPGKALAKGKDKRRLEEDRRRLMTGTYSVLALRVEAPDAMTTSNEATISDNVFGTGSDAVNLKSQYAACSHGQLNFVPATGAGITDGVSTVTISQTVTGVADGTVRNAVTTAGNAKFGTMSSKFDYVMECLPPGTSGSWIAYAYINHWLSVYNNQWCNYPSGQMHELGHNLNLAHAGEGATYDDQSGMMGYSYSSDEGPVMCFNAAKNYQLGWFSDRFTQIDLTGSSNGPVKLIGQADYTKSKEAQADDEQVGIRIVGGDKDYYVSFNRQTGNNVGTREAGNQVLVHERAKGTGYAVSKLLAKRVAGGTYTIPASDPASDILITVNSINTGLARHIATVTIGPADGDECSPNPCQNGGACTDGVSSYTCSCPAGYTGTNCETNINDCASNPCGANGVCTDGVDSYTCTCDAGFTGTNCETNIDDCGNSQCENGGTCVDGVNSYTCNCPSDYVGEFCEQFDYCASASCNNGQCTNNVDSYTCTCNAGFTGTNCEINIDECASNPNPCGNGQCIDGVNGYTCDCTGTGFEGTNCQNNVDDCSPNPCGNGQCIDGVNSYMCDCTGSGFEGTNCDININDCPIENPCLNGGTCNDGVNSYTCNCQPGYSGDFCEKVDVFICSKKDPGTASCGNSPQSDDACINSTCGRGNKCWKVTCDSTGAPGPSPSPPPPGPGPEPTPSPGPGPTTCGGLGKGDCKNTPGCTGIGSGKNFQCVVSGATELCSGSGGVCNADGDCCVGFCKGNGRCS